MIRSNVDFCEPFNARALLAARPATEALSRRGLIGALCVLAVGGLLVSSAAAGPIAVGDLLVVAGLAAVALVVGTRAEAKARLALAADGRWMSVLIEGDALGNAVSAVRPAPAPTLGDPERRSLTRRHRRSRIVEVA